MRKAWPCDEVASKIARCNAYCEGDLAEVSTNAAHPSVWTYLSHPNPNFNPNPTLTISIRACSHAVESSCHDDRGGRGEGGGEHSTSAVEEALRRQMEMQKVLQSQLEVRRIATRRPAQAEATIVRRLMCTVYTICCVHGLRLSCPCTWPYETFCSGAELAFLSATAAEAIMYAAVARLVVCPRYICSCVLLAAKLPVSSP